MKNRNGIKVMLGCVILAICMIGCSSRKETTSKDNVDAGAWFETEFHDFKLAEDEFVPSFSVYDNDLYFLTINTNSKTTNRIITLKKMSLDTYDISDLRSFTSDKDGAIINLFVDESGIYMTGQKIDRNSDYTKVFDANYKIIICELDGKLKKTFDISETLKDKWTEDDVPYLSDIVCDKDGNILVTDNMTFVIAYNDDGEKVADIKCDEWGNGFVVSEVGEVYYSYTGGLSMKQCLVPIEIESNKLGKKVAEIASYASYSYCIDENDTLWYSDENSLWTYNLKTEEKNKILNWLDYDITTDSVRMLQVMGEGSFLVCTDSFLQEQWGYELGAFKKTDKLLEEKTIITYATFGSDAEIMEAIVRFNKNSEEYRVKVIDYYDEENYEDAWNKYNQAILEDDFADIVNVSWSNYEMMAKKGLYVELNEFMDNDENINRGDYFQNVLEAYEVSDKLYAMPVSFSINTLVGKKDIWGDKESITLADVKHVMDSMPKDVEMLEGMSQTDFVFFMLQGSLDKFIDWDSGECSFDSDEFIEILDLAKRFPKKSKWDIFNDDSIDKYRQGKILLYNAELFEIGEYQVLETMLGEKIAFVGYPGANGGLIQTSGNLLAISKNSSNQEIAWEFVKSMISKEYQTSYIYYSIPIHKSAFEKQMESAMEKELYVDEEGNEVETAKMIYGYDDIEVEIYAARKEQVEEYRKIVEGATTLATYDQQIMLMVEEEIEAFFDNRKSAEEVAKIVQSRVKIYVNEIK